MSKLQTDLHARFISPSHHHSTLLQQTPPALLSALHSIYPFLVASNRILANITWTNDSSYRRFVLISFTSFAILHWNNYMTILMPFLLVLTFCSYAWFIKISIIDTTMNDAIPPTLEEILDTLDNFTKRFLFIFDLNTSARSYVNVITNLCLLTPFYVFIMKNFASTNIWLAALLMYLSTYYSTWCIAVRKLIWRSKSVRSGAEFVTGEKISKIDKDLEITILNMNTRGSIDEKTQIIEFHLTENERRWVGLGWTKKLFFIENKSPYYDGNSKQSFKELQDFKFPMLRNYPQSEWKWVDTKWRPDSGWVYFDNWWKHPDLTDSVAAFTRSRRLKRQCIVVLKK